MQNKDKSIEEQVSALVMQHLETASQEELHIFAARSNYDSNQAAIKILIDNPKLDRGTAILLFWYLGADYYARHTAQDVPEFQRPKDDLIRLIESRCDSGFYTDCHIYYDPYDSDVRPDEYTSIGPIKREISEIMYRPTNGTQWVDIDSDDYDDGLPLPVVEKIFALYD